MDERRSVTGVTGTGAGPDLTRSQWRGPSLPPEAPRPPCYDSFLICSER